MKRIIVLLSVLFLYTNISLSQNSYIRLIENGKFSKAEKKLNKELSKNPDDIELNYSMSVLLSNRKYKNYSPSRAYEFAVKSKDHYGLVKDDKELKRLNKIPIDNNLYLSLFDTISRKALEDATEVNTVLSFEGFLGNYVLSPSKYKILAIERRDIAAYKIACDANTEDSYQNFILKYPEATQTREAKQKRNAIAFSKAKTADNIVGYKSFISKYPDAVEVTQANDRIHELAFANAQKINTSASYKAFIDEYPNSKQYKQAFDQFEEKQFFENTRSGDWEIYKNFIHSFSTNSWTAAAKDSVLAYAVQTRSLPALKFCADIVSGSKKKEVLILLHDVYTDDGEVRTLNMFYSEYDDPLFIEIKEKDYENARLGDNLNLEKPYNEKDYKKYDEYIKIAAPNERAFVALQRVISADVANYRWKAAADKVKMYLPYFNNQSKKVTELLSMLEAKFDYTIKINSIGASINTKDGGEYSPVISADDKYLYFCGRDREDNIGGEDIYVAKLGTSIPAKVLVDLSTAYSHDAPESVSTDGTSMMLFKNGKLFSAEKKVNGWGQATELSSKINSGIWQADAMISSDGKALIFSSIKEGNYDFYISINPDYYHGENNYASDIYVSIQDNNGEWGIPVNLGPTINTIYCDRSPFLHPDMKTLYFSSSGHGGQGDLDVFKSTRLSDTCWDCWSEPINLGKEINSPGSDWGYKISTDGTKAYFAKQGASSKESDIFWLNLPKHLRPDLVATVSGRLVDKNNNPVSAEILWEDLETGKNVGKSKSDPANGNFFIVLPLGKIYGYYVERDEYFPISNNIDLRNSSEPVVIEENIDMVSFKQMIDDGTAVPVNNLFFKIAESALLPYSLPELKRVAKIIIANGLKVEISGHTDDIGEEATNQLLSEKRANAVKEFLILEGCDPAKLFVIGYGETKPVATNSTEEGRSKNRRVELRFIN